MVNDQNAIKKVLATAINIYSVEGDERIMLVCQDDRLYHHNTPGDDLAFEPIANVEYIVYIVELNAWQVTWIA